MNTVFGCTIFGCTLILMILKLSGMAIGWIWVFVPIWIVPALLIAACSFSAICLSLAIILHAAAAFLHRGAKS